MSEIAVTVRDATDARHAHIHGSTTDYLVAALSADPETVEELQAALARYLPDEAPQFFQRWHAGTDAQPWDAGVCVIDLAARLVVIQSTYSAPGTSGDVVVTGHDGRDESIRYHLAEDWLVTREVEGWESLARVRRDARAAPPFDARAVLYDRVCEFIASRCAAQPATDDHAATDPIRAIHADWLTAPRADLGELAPRDVLLRQRAHIDWDLQDRCEQWTVQRAAPPVLSKESAAYRFAGFGTHEIVLYYDLVRFLLHECWDHVHGDAFTPSEGAIAAETTRLRELRDAWLNSPEVEDPHGKTPAAVVEHERIRLPEGMGGADAVIDHDCPVCQMMADSPAPMFWHLDGCNIDDDFAFSFDLTREEWEAERRKWEEFNRDFDARSAARTHEADTPWLTSHANPEALDGPPAVAVFALAARLAELVQNLKDAGAAEHTIADLNRRFGNIREVAQGADLALAEPVIERLCETLVAVAAEYPTLAEKCADFEQLARDFGDRLATLPGNDH